MKQSMDQFDVVVIGSGPAGEGAAMMAAKNHRSVALIERYFEVGGGCTHWGTIPSKALRHAVKILHDLRRNPLLREFRGRFAADLSAIAGVGRARSWKRRWRAAGASTSAIACRSSPARRSSSMRTRSRCSPPSASRCGSPGKQIVIAAGSRPYHPPEVDFSHERVRDSDSILRYGEHPFSVTIYGAGVIGCEYASIFINLGAKVTLVNTHDRLLSFLDDEIAEALSYHLREQGCVIRHNEQFKALEARERDVVLHLESGRKIKSDLLLWANGRTGNSQHAASSRTSASRATRAARSQ